MSNIAAITFDDYILTFTVAQGSHLKEKEPIPVMNANSIDQIQYILEVPFQKVFGKTLYQGFYNKAAIMFYLMIKNHPLENGNKRMACYCLGLFYQLNNRKFSLTNTELYDLAYYVVNSHSNNNKETVVHVAEYLKNYDNHPNKK